MIVVALLSSVIAIGCADRESGAELFAGDAASLVSSRLTISPANATVPVGATLQLSAQNTSGQAVAVRWKTSNEVVATVSASGLVTARAAGSAVITAQSGKDKASATVTVTAVNQPTPIATVELSPATASIAVGQSVTLVATTRDALGNVLIGRAIAWSSSNTGVATVSSNGAVAGLSAGSATITATSEGQSGTAAITVSAPVPPPPSAGDVNECAAPRSEWIFCDDYEQDRLSKYFEYVSASGSFTRASGVGLSSSLGMKARWSTIGQVSAGNLKLAFGRTPSSYMRPVDAGTADYRDIYWRVYVRTQPNWVGGGYKFTRAIVFASSTWAEAAIGHLWTGGTTKVLTLDPASGTDAAGMLKTTTYNDFANLRWLGATSGQTALFDAAQVGSWYCVETHMKLNDAGTANGVFEFWINGNLEARRADLNWLGSYDAHGINAVFLENYWNNGAPQPQERYFDNLVVSTQRIGC